LETFSLSIYCVQQMAAEHGRRSQFDFSLIGSHRIYFSDLHIANFRFST